LFAFVVPGYTLSLLRCKLLSRSLMFLISRFFARQQAIEAAPAAAPAAGLVAEAAAAPEPRQLQLTLFEEYRDPAAEAMPPSLLMLVRARPTKAWNWRALTLNPAIPIAAMFEAQDLPWVWSIIGARADFEISDREHKKINWSYVSRNPKFDLAYMESRPDLPWDWPAASVNPSITLKDMLATRSAHKWDFAEATRNPAVTLADIAAHPDLPWNYAEVSKKTC